MELPSVTWLHVHGTKSLCTDAAPYWERSTSPPVVSKVGRYWNSTWPRSGSLLALIAVNNLSYSAGPEPTLLQETWMSGCVLFQSATDLSMPGTHDQNVSFTGPVVVLPPPELVVLPPQAAREAMMSSAKLTLDSHPSERRNRPGEEKRCII